MQVDRLALRDLHRDRNAELFHLLSSRSLSLAEPRAVDIYFRASNQREAALTARSLYSAGYLVTLLGPAGEGEFWIVQAGAKLAAEEMLSDEFTERMIALGAQHDAQYDGWGTGTL